MTVVEDIFSTREDYIKISAYVHGSRTEEWLARFREKWGGVFTLASTCDHWIDFIPPDIHKGKAMRALMEAAQIKKEEVMAFGGQLQRPGASFLRRRKLRGGHGEARGDRRLPPCVLQHAI